jgi:hypothetical protein
MTARLQGDIQIGTLGQNTGCAQGKDLGVGISRGGVQPLADDLAITDQNGSDRRVGGSPAQTSPGEAYGPVHELLFLGCHVGLQCVTG